MGKREKELGAEYQSKAGGSREPLQARSTGQGELLKAIDEHDLVLALGPAGTGKTYLAIAKAVEALEDGKVERIVLTRPAVEAGENLGFLPGGIESKLDPYLRPLYDSLTDRMGNKRVKMALGEGLIEIAPVAFMRGRTLNNAFVVIDEAQNCTHGQIKMLLTRLGRDSTMVLTGDPSQTDLKPAWTSGFAEIARRLETVPGCSVVRLKDADIVRHPLIAKFLRAGVFDGYGTDGDPQTPQANGAGFATPQANGADHGPSLNGGGNGAATGRKSLGPIKLIP